jgi:HAD superfamily hydrolase (TIGR01509 family)
MADINKKTILFDFDGVIIDSFGGAFGVNKKLEPALTEEWMRRRFEGNINDSYIDEKGRPATEEENKEFFNLYIPAMMKFKIFPGMLNVIKKLSKNYQLIIISSTISSPIREYMDKYDMSRYFTEIMGNDVHKSKVEKIKMVFNKYGISASDCLFVTDTLGDLREAEKTGVEGIGVTWGFHSAETLKRGNSVALVDSPDELVAEIDKYFSK